MKYLLGECHRTNDKSTLVKLNNGFVPSGTKPLPEPKLTQISVTIWRQSAQVAVHGGSSRPHIFIHVLSFSELLTTQGTAAYSDEVVTTVIFHGVI